MYAAIKVIAPSIGCALGYSQGGTGDVSSVAHSLTVSLPISFNTSILSAIACDVGAADNLYMIGVNSVSGTDSFSVVSSGSAGRIAWLAFGY